MKDSVIELQGDQVVPALAALEKAGYRVLIASNGADALAQYLKHRLEIRLILTDLMMPVMNGMQAVQAARDPQSAGARTAASLSLPPAEWAAIAERTRVKYLKSFQDAITGMQHKLPPSPPPSRPCAASRPSTPAIPAPVRAAAGPIRSSAWNPMTGWN